MTTWYDGMGGVMMFESPLGGTPAPKKVKDIAGPVYDVLIFKPGTNSVDIRERNIKAINRRLVVGGFAEPTDDLTDLDSRDARIADAFTGEEHAPFSIARMTRWQIRKVGKLAVAEEQGLYFAEREV